MKTFKNSIAWVTGASSGIGEELCMQLAKYGAKVILSARKADQLEEVRMRMPRSSEHLCIPLDLERSEEFKEKYELILERFGRVDYLFNNGGLSQRAEAVDTVLETDRKLMEINFFGNIALSKVVLPGMIERKSGHIVVTSSIAGKFGFYLRSSYCATKHALHGFYESLALEQAKNGIHVTLVVPGKINTPISMNALKGDGSAHNIMDHNQQTGMSVQRCVHLMLKAVSGKKAEVLIGRKEVNAVWIKRFFPRLFRSIIKRQSAT